MTMPESCGAEIRHIAVFAFPFGGHARPLLGLVYKLALTMPDVQFSFFNTRKSNEQLFVEDGGLIPDNVKPYSVADGTPPDHVFSDNPHEAADLFLKAVPENLKSALDLANVESGVRITAILADSFLSSVGEMAEEMHVPWVMVWIAPPHCLYVYMYIDTIRQRCSNSTTGSYHSNQGQVPEIIPGASAIRAEDLPDGVLVPGELGGTTLANILDNISSATARAAAIVINFYHELDLTPHTDYLRSQSPNLLCLGFLSLLLPPHSMRTETNCFLWLDKQEPESVVYISFGTVVGLPRDEQDALAEALEASERPYLWSLGDKMRGNLPAGFLQRTAGRGRAVPWAPQTEVLAHPSVGAFVTHCGSNSVYESIASGVPMICRPFFGDHRMNARMVEEVWEIGVTVGNRVMTKDGVMESFEVVFAERGKKMRERAQALRQLLNVAAGPNGKAAQDFKKLVNILS